MEDRSVFHSSRSRKNYATARIERGASAANPAWVLGMCVGAREARRAGFLGTRHRPSPSSEGARSALAGGREEEEEEERRRTTWRRRISVESLSSSLADAAPARLLDPLGGRAGRESGARVRCCYPQADASGPTRLIQPALVPPSQCCDVYAYDPTLYTRLLLLLTCSTRAVRGGGSGGGAGGVALGLRDGDKLGELLSDGDVLGSG